MKQRTRIEHPLAVVQKLIAAADEAGAPLAIRIDFHPLVARREHNCARRCVGNRDGVGEDALHALVGREGMALSMPIAANTPTISRSKASSGSCWIMALISS